MKTKRRGHGEGSVYQRASDGRWVGVVDLGHTDGKRVRKTVYGVTRKEVADQVRVLQHQRDQGQPIATDRQTVGQFLEVWLTTVVKGNKRNSTYRYYERVVRLHLTPSLGRIPLTKLTAQDVQRMIAAKQQTLAPNYVRLCRIVLGTALNQAVRWRLIPLNMASLATTPAPPHPEQMFLTPDQARRLLAAARGTRFEAVYRVALALGLRKGEVLGLRWQDVDFEHGTVRVEGQLQHVTGQQLQWLPPKTATSRRTLPLPASLAQALRVHRHRQLQEKLLAGTRWQETGYVFTTAKGTGLYAGVIQKDFAQILERADLPHIRFHDLRHSCASLLAAQGVPARVAMEILGHANIAMTQDIYTHVLEQSTRDGVNALEQLLDARNEG